MDHVDIVKILKNFERHQSYVHYSDFVHTIVELGFNQRAYVDLACLVRMVDTPMTKCPGMLDYKSIVRDLKTRPFSWWQDKL